MEIEYQYKRWLYLSPFANSSIVHYLRFLFRKDWIFAVIKKFGREVDSYNIMPQIKSAYIKYHWNVEEYFLFKYETLSDEQRKQFCSEYDHNIFCLKVNDFKVAKVFRDKWATYQKFKDYFKRVCVLVKEASDFDKEDVRHFLSNNGVFLAKPISSCCGRGIKRISNSRELDDLRSLLCLEGGGTF